MTLCFVTVLDVGLFVACREWRMTPAGAAADCQDATIGGDGLVRLCARVAVLGFFAV